MVVLLVHAPQMFQIHEKDSRRLAAAKNRIISWGEEDIRRYGVLMVLNGRLRHRSPDQFIERADSFIRLFDEGKDAVPTRQNSVRFLRSCIRKCLGRMASRCSRYRINRIAADFFKAGFRLRERTLDLD